ncbi:MAG: ABC transporter substrate-binding protein [Treponema sp.]|jgi:raffinose/stachyose/melibiose transport system substrate-binding protein|nr:ABC transporter substrate-binding protein [Treponema sp.]
MRKMLLIALAITFCAGAAFAGGGQSAAKAADGVIEVTIPHYKSGQNVGGAFFLPQVERFNQKYAGKYRLIIEELVQDMYAPKMQQLGQQGKLPALVEGGSYEWLTEFIIPNNMFADLKSLADGTSDIKNLMVPESLAYNTVNGGKLFSVNFPVVRPIGLYYNPKLYQPPRSFAQMSWDEVSASLGDNKIAFMTGENAWTAVLVLSSLIAKEPGGPQWLASGANANPRLTDYNNPIMISAVTKLQQLLQKHASSNTLGAAYADAANSFMSTRSAIIANGPWMIGDFAPDASAKWSNGFNGADVRGDVFPGNVAVGGPPVGYGWWIPSTASAGEQELAKAFIAFIMSQDELERYMLAEGGASPRMTPSAGFLAERAKNKLMDEYVGAVNANTILAYNIGDVIPHSVYQVEIGRLLPLLINGTLSPAQFCQELTVKAKESAR